MSSLSGSQAALAWNFYQNPRQPYEDFVSNYILKPLKFTFVQRHYDRPLAEFVRELPELMHHFTTIHGPGGGSEWLVETVRQIEKAGFPDLYAFLDRVTTRSQAQGFLEISGVSQPCLMAWMDYLYDLAKEEEDNEKKNLLHPDRVGCVMAGCFGDGLHCEYQGKNAHCNSQ